MPGEQFKESAEILKEKQKHIKAEKALAEKTGLSISIKPDMTLEQMHEILMKEMELIIKDPRVCIKQGLGQAAFTGVAIRGVTNHDLVLDVSIRETRDPDAIHIQNKAGDIFSFREPSIVKLTAEAEKLEKEKTLEQKQQRALVATYDNIIRRCSNGYYPDVLPDLQMKPGMSAEQMRQIFVKKLKLIAESPKTLLVRSGGELEFKYNNGKEIRPLFTLIIDNNSKDYGKINSGQYRAYRCVDLEGDLYYGTGRSYAKFDIYDKQLADYFVKEYDRLSEIERLPEPKPQQKPQPQPQPKPDKKQNWLDKLFDFFKGNSKS